MFQIKHNECVGFESRWKVKKVSYAVSTQTTEYATSEMATNSTETTEIEIQTESTESVKACDVDEEKLAQWLKKIYPQVKRELDDCEKSKAFKGYRFGGDRDAECKLVQTVDVTSHLKDPEIGSFIAALSWNCTNQTLAVSSIYKHNSWCYHEGSVLCYTLDKDDNLSRAPRVKLHAESCVTALEFHPVDPAIIAGGLFSGGVIIWSIRKDAETVVKVESHEDRVSQICWTPNLDIPKELLLVSSSLDGLLILWNFNLNDSKLTVREKHQIRSPRFPRAADPDAINKIVRGVTCFNFSKFDPTIYIVGAEGGLVIQCSLIGPTKLPAGKEDTGVILDSTLRYYEGHKGEINSISFSPNRKDMFLTLAADLEIRIYMIEQEQPAKVIFLKSALNFVSWVPFEDKLICGCGDTGYINIMNVVKGQEYKNTTKEKLKAVGQTQIQINKTKPNIVATTTDSGLIQMWRVPWNAIGNLPM